MERIIVLFSWRMLAGLLCREDEVHSVSLYKWEDQGF